MALCLHKTVDELLDQLGDDELYLWQVYFSYNPMPDSWTPFQQTANICSSVFGAAGVTIPPERFMPSFDEKKVSNIADNLEDMKKLLYSVSLPKKIDTVQADLGGGI